MTVQSSPERKIWLDAWYDPVASLAAFSSCVQLVDLNSDGDFKLLVADRSKYLKFFKGLRSLSFDSLFLSLSLAASSLSLSLLLVTSAMAITAF